MRSEVPGGFGSLERILSYVLEGCVWLLDCEQVIMG